MTTRYRSFMPQLKFELRGILFPAIAWLLVMFVSFLNYYWKYEDYLSVLIHSPISEPHSILIMHRLYTTPLPFLFCAILAAIFQQTFARLPKRTRYMESLPTTRLQRSLAQLTAGWLAILIPLLLAVVLTCLFLPAVLQQIASYAVASPFMNEVLYQSTLAFPLFIFLRIGLISLTLYTFFFFIMSLFGNGFAGAAYIGLGLVIGVWFTTTSNRYYGSFENLLGRGIKNLIERSFLVTTLSTNYDALPWDNIAPFSLLHLGFIALFGSLSLAMAKKIKLEKIGDILLNQASRFAVLMLGFLSMMGFIQSLPTPSDAIGQRIIVITYIILFALMGLLIYFLYGKGFKKRKSGKRFLSLLLVTALLGGTAGAKAQVPIPTSHAILEALPTEAAFPLANGGTVGTGENFRLGNTVAEVGADGMIVDTAMLENQVSFLNEATKMLHSENTRVYTDSYPGNWVDYQDYFEYYSPQVTNYLANPSETAYYDFYHSLQRGGSRINMNQQTLDDEDFTRIVLLMNSHGYEKTGTALLEALSSFKKDFPQPPEWPGVSCRFFEEDIGYFLRYYGGSSWEPSSVECSIYFEMPISLKEAQPLQKRLQSLPLLDKTTAFHNGTAGYLNYDFSDETDTYWGAKELSIIIQDDRITHVTIDFYADVPSIKEAAIAALNAIFEDSPEVLSAALDVLEKSGSSKVAGYAIENRFISRYGRNRLTIISIPQD